MALPVERFAQGCSEREGFAHLLRKSASTHMYSYKPLQNVGKGLIVQSSERSQL
jgi:hypothetical protein